MTISTTIIKNSYSGNASQTVFPYTFKISADADIQVILRSALGTETVKTISTDYTVSGAGNANGGNVTMVVAPASGETLVIRRATIQTQTIDLVENDPFSAETVEGGFDKSVSLVQEIQEEADRAIKLSRTNTMASTEFTVDAVTRAGKILGFDSAGELVVSQELGSFRGNWTTGTTYAARDIVKDTSNNNIYLCNTGHTASGSQPISTNTDVAKWDLLVDAYSATASATAAAVSAAAALVSENNASTSESNALTYKNNAETAKTAAELAETNAETAQTAAEVAQAAAEAALDNFDDRFLGAKASDPTVDNDGDALTDGALYFNTTDDVMKVYDLTNTTWRQIQLTTSDQANVNTVAADLSGSNTIGTVAGLNTEITNLAGLNTEITNLNNIRTDISGVNAISAAVSAVNTNAPNINTVNSNSVNINTVAGLNTEIALLGTSGTVASINTAATNLADINAFANIYLGPSATAPTQDPDGSALDVGDLYFDTVSQTMKVYSSSGWIPAGSSVNGTSARFTYTISGTPSSVSGADDNGNTLAYDAGFADVFVNGVRMSSADITITSGTSVVFATALTNGDVVDIVAYGTFNVASIDASNITSGTLNIARIADNSITNAKLATPFSLTLPAISSISPTTIDNSQATITITGSNFTSVPQVEFLNPSTGIWYTASTVTFNNSTSLTVTVTLSVDAQYKVRVENPDGLAILSGTILTVSDAPTWNTAAGDLGTFEGNFSGTLVTLSATSDSAITYSEVGSNLTTANVTLNPSTGALTTTDFGGISTTAQLYNFTIRATDAENQTADRSFSLTSSYGATGGAGFN